MAREVKDVLGKIRDLSETETPSTLESFWEDLIFRLSLHPQFIPFLESYWEPYGLSDSRGLHDDQLLALNPWSGMQKCASLNLMLGAIASRIPVISRKFITREACSLRDVKTRLRVHYGFSKSGGLILDMFNLPSDDFSSHEVLWEKISYFISDNLMDPQDGIYHCGILPESELLTPTLQNLSVVLWLHSIHPQMPSIVKHRYATQLRTNSIYSLRDDISGSVPLFLSEISEGRIASSQAISCRVNGKPRSPPTKFCILCHISKRPSNAHFLTACPHLPERDATYFRRAKTRLVHCTCEDTGIPSDVVSQISAIAVDKSPTASLTDPNSEPMKVVPPETASTKRVKILCSPVLQAVYGNKEVSVTLDSGAESDLISEKEAKRLGVPILRTGQGAGLADGVTQLYITGEAHFILLHGHHKLNFSGLVAKNLNTPILGGAPFHDANDIHVRIKQNTINIGDCCQLEYNPIVKCHGSPTTRAITGILKASSRTTLLPGEEMKFTIPNSMKNEQFVAVEPRLQSKSYTDEKHSWLCPSIQPVESGMVTIANSSPYPVCLARHEQFCNIRLTETIDEPDVSTSTCNFVPCGVNETNSMHTMNSNNDIYFSDKVDIDNGGCLPKNIRDKFLALNRKHDNVFNTKTGLYNGASGPFEAHINMGETKPPQRKGRIPLYKPDDKVRLQQKFDILDSNGVTARPNEVDVVVENLNSSFLVQKNPPSTDDRLVTSFGEVAEFAKPQPSLMSNVEDTLRHIGRWKCLIVTDLSESYHQLPLAKGSMKYVGVCTPFKGIRVFTRCAMGMPGSETALEELMCLVLGDLLVSGKVVKIADDLFCGGDTPEEVLHTWSLILSVLEKNGLRLSARKTRICPLSTTILGWIWSNGTLTASPHRLSALETCAAPTTVKGMRSFIGAYKFLGRVIPNYCDVLSPLESVVAGRESKTKIEWTEELFKAFQSAQKSLSRAKSLVMPRPSDEIQIMTDACISKMGMGATMYVIRNGKPHLAGFFNAKLNKSQRNWLPCEIEALCIGSSIKFFGPYITQSSKQATVFTDSKPCVQAYRKVMRGEFSNSARVMTFLSTLTNFSVNLMHVKGTDNLVADFSSRQPVECIDNSCQVCRFIQEDADSVIRYTVADITQNLSSDLYLNRKAWHNVQESCKDLRRVHSHLKRGTRPLRKHRHLRDVRHYLNHVIIARDGLLVVKNVTALTSLSERIVVPRSVINGLVTAMHIKLQHPSKHQLRLTIERQFYAIGLDKIINLVSDKCHTCASLKSVPNIFHEQSTSELPPDCIGRRFSADIVQRSKQKILLIRENVSALTQGILVDNETAPSLRDGLICLTSLFRSTHDPLISIRVDPASAFRSLVKDQIVAKYNIQIDIGDEKNPNKNPIAERCNSELHAELCKLQPQGGPIVNVVLAVAISNMNALIRGIGLSSMEIWCRRHTSTGEEISISDHDVIEHRVNQRKSDHLPSAKFKARGKTEPPVHSPVNKGDIVYLYQDRDKTCARDPYLVVDKDKDSSFCSVQKLRDRQFRARSYNVRDSDCIVPDRSNSNLSHLENSDSDSSHGNHSDSNLNDSDVESDFSVDMIEKKDRKTGKKPGFVEVDLPGRQLLKCKPGTSRDSCGTNVVADHRQRRSRNVNIPSRYRKDFVMLDDSDYDDDDG